jgi:hypothetical protein
MVEIRFIISTDRFERDVKKTRDKGLKEKLRRQIDKISGNPRFGKPLQYHLKGEWSIYVVDCYLSVDD